MRIDVKISTTDTTGLVTEHLQPALLEHDPITIPLDRREPVKDPQPSERIEMMTSCLQVISERLPASGFNFAYPHVRVAVHTIVEKPQTDCPLSGLFNASKQI
jgi:hypothetical protein